MASHDKSVVSWALVRSAPYPVFAALGVEADPEQSFAVGGLRGQKVSKRLGNKGVMCLVFNKS